MHDLAQEDGVISGFDDRREAALDIGDAAAQQRRAGHVGVPFDAFKAALRLHGERHRKIALGFVQDVYSKARARAKMR